mmetsp:Transcript_31088/g.99369  ORF Transcript_31088/g.99369 Transcript_31088/m.99369 type:complete len:228 (-) Transcript_31088:273-956(-)
MDAAAALAALVFCPMRPVVGGARPGSAMPPQHTALRFVGVDRGAASVGRPPCWLGAVHEAEADANCTGAGGRRSLSLARGWRLSGNLHTLGYFAADVCVGSPARTFALIIDTGSGMTALPCDSCEHCGRHARGARFDPTASRTARVIGCAEGCDECDGGRCSYSVEYAEGSSISGTLVEDEVRYTRDGNATPLAARTVFGCQTLETGLFYSQQADGIAGFARARAGR